MASRKSEKIEAIVEQFQGREFDAHYLAYFECFNQQLYYEAHEVLEKLWLPKRKEPDGGFYKGLIQLAGAFVHLQKNRPRPAGSLFKLAQENLGKYGGKYQGLDLNKLLERIESWTRDLQAGKLSKDVLGGKHLPRLFLSD